MTPESKVVVSRVGSIWHGTIEGHPEVDERGLTREVAERKAKDALRRISERSADPRR